MAFDVTGSSSKTINSLSLKLVSMANMTGFTVSNWNSRKVYLCKTTFSAGANMDSTSSWNDLDGWASSGTYEAAEETVVHNAAFFGANF